MIIYKPVSKKPRAVQLSFGGRTMAKGKRSEDEVLARKLMVLEQICRHKEGVRVSDLKDLIPDEYRVGEGTIKKDVEDLRLRIPIVDYKQGKVCMPPTGIREIWSGTPVGERLRDSLSKEKLAKKVFSFVQERHDAIQRLILGDGTTVYECACELIKGASHFRGMRIHTANLLVLHEFVWHKPDNLYLELAGGEPNFQTAALGSKNTAKYFKSIEAQAVITTFSDISFERGFCTVHHDDIVEKLANLKPNPKTCKWVVIPIEWRKVGHSGNTLIARTRQEQLDFVGGKRKYIIITDKPSDAKWDKEVDDPKLEDLLKWRQAYPEGVEIVYA